MPRSVLRVGTRGSALALAQAETVRKAISQVISHRNFELVPITTKGDTHQGPLPAIGGKGLFTEDIQEALATAKIDLAVHSAKDLPATSAEGVVLAAIPPREDPRDALITRHGGGLAKLPPGTPVGTSALRRSVQLLALGKGLVPTPIRGNVDTRLRKLSAGEVQALVVALAGLKRLGKDGRVAEILPTTMMLPAPGQGALAVECRAGDKDMREALSKIEDPLARRAFEAERAFLLALGGSCNVPLGALATLDGNEIRLRGLVGTLDGSRIIRDEARGTDPHAVAHSLAERFLAAGAGDIIASLEAGA
ncbi:MAG: hydroxymethylbilane synthase [Actinomycetota bacterium]